MADLITLAQAHSYLQIPDAQTSDDDMIQAFINGASAEFLLYTSLPYIAETAFTERRNGTGTASITCRNRPLQSISSLVIDNLAVNPSPDGVQSGYVFEQAGTAIYLVGGYTAQSMPFRAIGFQGYPGRFSRGFGNIFITGTAGYPNQTATVTATIPNAMPPATVVYYSNTAFAAMSVANGAVVTNLNTNAPFTLVTGTPAAGEFALSPTAVFCFSAADAGIPVSIAYYASTIPFDIQKCVYEMVGWAYKNRDRIGKASAHFADNLTESYRSTPFSSGSQLTINRYTRKDAVGW
jgi:hypothetical protein